MSSDSDSRLPDLRYVRELARVFKQYELDEIEIETADQRVLLRRAEPGRAPPALAAAPALPIPSVAMGDQVVATSESAEATGEYITSPFVGTFYRSPRPDAPSFADVGARVAQGQTLCIVEAMKLFNEIEAEFPCVIEEVLVESGQPVEYGARLFRVRRL